MGLGEIGCERRGGAGFGELGEYDARDTLMVRVTRRPRQAAEKPDRRPATGAEVDATQVGSGIAPPGRRELEAR